MIEITFLVKVNVGKVLTSKMKNYLLILLRLEKDQKGFGESKDYSNSDVVEGFEGSLHDQMYVKLSSFLLLLIFDTINSWYATKT